MQRGKKLEGKGNRRQGQHYHKNSARLSAPTQQVKRACCKPRCVCIAPMASRVRFLNSSRPHVPSVGGNRRSCLWAQSWSIWRFTGSGRRGCGRSCGWALAAVIGWSLQASATAGCCRRAAQETAAVAVRYKQARAADNS